MATSTTSAVSDRFVFHWSLLSISACLLLVGASSLAWLHDDIGHVSKMILELLCCGFLALDLVLHKNHLRKMLRGNILRSATVLAVVPWYVVTTTAFNLPNQSMLLFLAHVSYAPYLYFRYQSFSHEHIAPKWVRVTLVLILATFCLHWLASIWMILTPRKDVDFATEYNLAMYFLMTTVATVGYGDITPTDNYSRVYTMFLQILGIGMFGIVIGQVSKLIVDADKRKEHAKNQIDNLVALFKHYEIPSDLQKKSYRFLNHVLAHASNEDEQKVLQALPLGLQAELRTYMNIRPISRVSLFAGCSKECLMEAALELQQSYFTPGQAIIRKGEIGESMYLIGHGQVDVADGARHIASLSDGQCFGEMALLADEPRGADVTAVSHCDVFVLARQRFQHLLASHPDLRANVDKVSSARKRAG